MARNEIISSKKEGLQYWAVVVAQLAVASDTRGPWCESSHRQLLLNQYFLITVCRIHKNKEKGAGNGLFCNIREVAKTRSRCKEQISEECNYAMLI